MLNALSESFTALIGSNQVLYACEVMLSSIKAKQLFQTDSAVLLIMKSEVLLVSYFRYGQEVGKGANPNNFLTLQICEQKNEKKNTVGIEFLVFFPHTR
tara:strand:+ start:761 stop:1057 length:297 start_codon:yes stop_codon:yes gene_type:complete